MNSVLTLDFGITGIAGKPPTLAGGGFKLSKMKQGTNSELNYLLLKNYKVNMPWINFNESMLKKTRQKMSWHSCRIGMDPSILGYENSVEYQKRIVLRLIDEFSSDIKYLALIYEWGTNGKLHWHFLISINGIRKFRKAAMAAFGYRNAIYFKKVEPNKGETFEENLKRILLYYVKEEHNKESCFLTKNV